MFKLLLAWSLLALTFGVSTMVTPAAAENRVYPLFLFGIEHPYQTSYADVEVRLYGELGDYRMTLPNHPNGVAFSVPRQNVHLLTRVCVVNWERNAYQCVNGDLIILERNDPTGSIPGHVASVIRFDAEEWRAIPAGGIPTP
tara:strand:+ start:595 stop:1020 length:426 start_codon:yes stop_codon:yes gene_type:complete